MLMIIVISETPSHLNKLDRVEYSLWGYSCEVDGGEMPVTKCPVAECIYTTGDVGDAVGAVLLGHHLQSVHP